MQDPHKHPPGSSLSLAMLISEFVYRLVVLVERLLRMIIKFVVRPCLLQLRCLFW